MHADHFLYPQQKFWTYTFVFKHVKALWYRTLKKKKKKRLLPDLKPSQNVLKHSLFKLWKFHEYIKYGSFFARGQNVLYNAKVLWLWAPSIMPLYVNMSLLSKVKRKSTIFFFLVKFSRRIWGANSYILPNFLSQGAIVFLMSSIYKRA